MRLLIAALALFALFACAARADAPYVFGVVTQRSALLTAEYWNPILRYVSLRSKVPLKLKLARTGAEHAQMIARGEFDFLYSNHNFTPANSAVGYRVIARPSETAIRGQLAVRDDSDVHALADLREREVAFPHPQAFVGYFVTQDALIKAGVQVKSRFAGNQEGAMAQLKAGTVAAASVNSQLLRDYAAREGMSYRIIWSSDEYLNIPISVHPRVPRDKARAVREALIRMANDAEGRLVLKESAAKVNQAPPYGFVAADDRDYDNVRRFYRQARVREQ